MIYFYCWKSWKNMYFQSKRAWPPPTYDVITRNHRHGPSPNLTQNVCEGWTNSYGKRQVLKFYPLEENSDKPYGGGGGGGTTPRSHFVRPRVKSPFLFLIYFFIVPAAKPIWPGNIWARLLLGSHSVQEQSLQILVPWMWRWQIGNTCTHENNGLSKSTGYVHCKWI